MSACWYSSNNSTNAQARYARKLAPARVGQSAHKVYDEVKTLKLRVYADATYRSATLQWQARFRNLIRRANKVITPLFGVELDVVDFQPWERTDNSNSMVAMLEELELIDPADDVDFVVGLVSPLDSASSELSLLGMARPLSPHLVMRGMSDVAERTLFDQIFDELDASDRERLYKARKAHKELTLFLHEWAHTLGALHTHNAVEIMNIDYDQDVREFARLSVGLIEIGLKYRGQGALSPEQRGAMMNELVTFVEASDRKFWIDTEVEQFVSMLQMPQATGPSERASVNLTPAARHEFYTALDFEKAGRFQEAWDIVFPMTETYRDEPQVQVFGCRLAARVKKLEWPTPETCALAAKLSPHDPIPPLALASAYDEAGDSTKALVALRRAHEVLEGAPQARQEHWLVLASAYQKRDLFTWMEQALENVADNAVADDMRRFALQTRRRYGLPSSASKFGIAPEHEGDYLSAVKQSLSSVYANKFADAKELVKQGRKTYPKAPGFLVVDCDLQMRIGKSAVARKSCAKAIKLWDESMWAYYLLGSMDSRAKKHEPAIKHIERAIELDPEMKALWTLLAKLYEKAGKKDQLERLERLYRGQFNEALR